MGPGVAGRARAVGLEAFLAVRPASRAHPRTLAVAGQRRLFRCWTTDPAVHPHEALTGLLALLHAAPSRELRTGESTGRPRAIPVTCPPPAPW